MMHLNRFAPTDLLVLNAGVLTLNVIILHGVFLFHRRLTSLSK